MSDFLRIRPDGRIWFQFEAPSTAESVTLVLGGDNYHMRKETEGTWNVVVPRADPGFDIYSFMVDGTRMMDPGSRPFFVNGYVSALEYPGPDDDFYSPRRVPHGDVREHWFHSDVTGSFRRMYVYTPPDYEQNVDTRDPVLYLQHGGDELESEWTHAGRANFILDNLLAEGLAKPMIIVMNNGFASRTWTRPIAHSRTHRTELWRDFQWVAGRRSTSDYRISTFLVR